MTQRPWVLGGELPLRRVLITGASGFIGAHLADALAGAGVHVVGTSQQVRQVGRVGQARHVGSGSGPTWLAGDLSDPGFAEECMNSANPDAVFHLAGTVTGSRALEQVLPTYHSLLTSTVNLLSAAAGWGDPVVVLVGSLEEPDRGSTAPANSPYAAAKEASRRYAEMFHSLFGTRVVNTRVAMAYGPADPNHARLVPYLIDCFRRGDLPRLSSGGRKADWIYIDDVVRGLVAAATCPHAVGGTIDVGTGVTSSVRDVVALIARTMGVPGDGDWGSLPDRADERRTPADVAATARRCGWTFAVDLDEGIRRTVEATVRSGAIGP